MMELGELASVNKKYRYGQFCQKLFLEATKILTDLGLITHPYHIKMLNELAAVHEKLDEYKNATSVYRNIEKLLTESKFQDKQKRIEDIRSTLGRIGKNTDR